MWGKYDIYVFCLNQAEIITHQQSAQLFVEVCIILVLLDEVFERTDSVVPFV